MILATWPPRCAECGKFMRANNSRIERRDHGMPWCGPDEYEVGLCDQCESDKSTGHADVLLELANGIKCEAAAANEVNP